MVQVRRITYFFAEAADGVLGFLVKIAAVRL
jgi:hypothetical protein